jgi:hypothetical protein
VTLWGVVRPEDLAKKLLRRVPGELAKTFSQKFLSKFRPLGAGVGIHSQVPVGYLCGEPRIAVEEHTSMPSWMTTSAGVYRSCYRESLFKLKLRLGESVSTAKSTSDDKGAAASSDSIPGRMHNPELLGRVTLGQGRQAERFTYVHPRLGSPGKCRSCQLQPHCRAETEAAGVVSK